MAEKHVSEFFAEVFRKAGMKRSMKRAEAVVLWPRVVGADVARFTTARALREGVLYVDVTDSETAMHLSMQRSRFLAEYRSTYGVTDVREVRFQVGRVAQPQPVNLDQQEVPPLDKVEPHDLARLASNLYSLNLPEDVAQLALRAGQRLLALQAARRAQGWTPCPTCGALHDGNVRPLTPREETLRQAGRREERAELARQLCAACARYAQEGRVRSAAARLQHEPMAQHPDLTDDEVAVAQHLAMRHLDERLMELMPAAALDSKAVATLEQVARCRVALSSNVAPEHVTDLQIEQHDARLATLLRRHA